MKERGYVHIQIHNHGFIVLHIYIYLYTSTFCMAYLLSIPTISKRYKNTWTWFCKQQLNVLSYLNVPYMNVYKYLELHVHV